MAGTVPSALGALLIVLTLISRTASFGVPALVTGAVLSLALPAAVAVDSLVKARVEVERIRLQSRLADLSIARSDKAISDTKEDWRAIGR
jgi:hypothetical protein